MINVYVEILQGIDGVVQVYTVSSGIIASIDVTDAERAGYAILTIGQLSVAHCWEDITFSDGGQEDYMECFIPIQEVALCA